METLTGIDELSSLWKRRKIDSMKKRFCFSQLMDYLNGGDDPRICTLYGLRRTGKTILMAQASKELKDPDSVCWVMCEPGDEIQDVKKAIRENPKCQYFFLDEVTKLENFTDASSILADRYAAIDGKKIVLAGTDSLGFHFAFGSELFDRTHVIHTTYIPYKEYRYLLGKDKTIDDYIEYGGTLTNGSAFYNKEPGMDYSNDAIVKNILHSLEHYQNGGAYGSLLPFHAAHELTTFINKIVELDNRTFLAETVNRLFKSHDMGILRSRLSKELPQDDGLDVLKSQAFRKEIRDALGIREPLTEIATTRAIEEVKGYLEALDVIYVIPGTNRQSVIFSQPGLRYSQVQEEKKHLMESPLLHGIPTTTRNDFAEKLDEIIKGRMMENILFLDLTKDPTVSSQYRVTTYRDGPGRHEFDIVLMDKKEDKAILLEVKHSKAFDPVHQARHLFDADACKDFEAHTGMQIAGKGVVYRGDTRYYAAGIHYLHVDALLEHPKECIQMLQNSWDSHIRKTERNPIEH